MKRISRAQQTEINNAVSALGDAGKELEAAVASYNEALERLGEAVETARDTYNEKVVDLKAVYEEIHGEADSYYSDRSERWQEGEAGEAYSEWMGQLEEPGIEDIEIELPDPLEIDLPDFEDDSWLPPSEPGGG